MLTSDEVFKLGYYLFNYFYSKNQNQTQKAPPYRGGVGLSHFVWSSLSLKKCGCVCRMRTRYAQRINSQRTTLLWLDGGWCARATVLVVV